MACSCAMNTNETKIRAIVDMDVDDGLVFGNLGSTAV